MSDRDRVWDRSKGGVEGVLAYDVINVLALSTPVSMSLSR